MKNEKSPSHILPIILMVISIILMSSMLNQLENNSIKKTNEIQNLKMELDIANDKLQDTETILNSYKNYFNNKNLNKETESDWQCFVITGYNANSGEQGTSNKIATTFNLDHNRVKNLPIIAVDPEVIPLYSIVEIEDLGAFIALDTGGLIKGNRIDILCQDVETAYEITGEYSIRILKKGMSLAD